MLKQLHEAMSENITLNLTIMKKGDEVTVMMITKANIEDPAYENLPPITSSGNPEEVESDLIKAVIEPIKIVAKSVSGVEEFLKASEKAEAENKSAKEKAAAEKKEKSGKGKSGKETNTSKDEEKPVAKKAPFYADLDKLFADGHKAIAEKRDISGKAFRAKIQNIIDVESAKEPIDEEYVKKFDEYCSALNQLVLERSGGSLFDTETKIVESNKIDKTDSISEKPNSFGLSEDELKKLDEPEEEEF